MSRSRRASLTQSARPLTPSLAVDLVIRIEGMAGRIVLIERHNPPHGWALPGGFVAIGETLEHAAVREAREETGLEIRLDTLLGCYSRPDRDPRGHTVSAVYLATANGEPVAADDARCATLVDPADPGRPLAFDHRLILDDYLRWLETGEVAPLRM